MGHSSKWRRICGIQKSQECYNCANKKEILENKNKIIVVCDIGYGERKLEFSRNLTPYCGAYKIQPQKEEQNG